MVQLVKEPGAEKAARVENEPFFTRFLRSTEIDARLLGMLGALALIWIGFHLYGQLVNGFGAFLTLEIFGTSRSRPLRSA